MTIDSRTARQQAADVLDATASRALAASVAALRVLALGPVEVYRHGVLLSGDVWASTKPRELLLFLLCHPEGCSKGQVGLTLWPESSAERVRNSFHVTLHRLRKALGDPTLVLLQGEMYRIAAGDVFFDAAIFEAEASAALRTLRGDAAASQLALVGEHRPRRTESVAAAKRLEAALALYRGDFLEHESVGDWHLAVRDRLRRLHLDALTALAGWCFEADETEHAAELCRRILVLDETNEEAYRRLMTLHARAGERAQALRLFDRLASALRDEFDAEPSEQTIRLHARIQTAAEV